MSRRMDDQQGSLRDAGRLAAFARAMSESVRTDDVVADARSGAGLLALLACRAGARRVYACHDSRLAGIVRRIVADNGCADRVVHIDGGPGDVALPERADVVILDALGRTGTDDGIVFDAAMVRHRWLREGGALMPSRIATWVAPVEHAGLHAMIDFWRRPVDGCDCRAMRAYAVNTPYPHDFAAAELLAPGVEAVSFDLTTVPADARGEATSRFHVQRAGTLHGVAIWGAAQLSPHVSVTNAPDAPGRIGRRQMFLPIDAPLTLAQRDEVIVHLSIDTADTAVDWTVDVQRDGRTRARSDQSSRRGSFAPPSDARPAVTDRARAYRHVLQLCDGRRTLAEIERDLQAAYPRVFRDDADVSALAADVVLRHARDRSGDGTA